MCFHLLVWLASTIHLRISLTDLSVNTQSFQQEENIQTQSMKAITLTDKMCFKQCTKLLTFQNISTTFVHCIILRHFGKQKLHHIS